MPAELIKKTDTNRLAFPKINQAIQDAYEAVTKASKADDNSNQALNKTRSVQSQINQLVIEGDSSVEAAQARVDDEGRTYSTLQERLNAEKSQIKTDIETTRDQVLNDYKNFYLDKAAEVYLYDLQLAMGTVNQSIAFDEVGREIYATQAYDFAGDSIQSFVITRMTFGGKMLDKMTIRFGGHGTSIGIERTGGKIYIWSNFIQTDSSGKQVNQYLCRYLYQPNAEIRIDSPGVTRFDAFPNSKLYMSPFTDTKNKLLAQRHTDNRNELHSWIEVYDMEEYKKGNKRLLYTFQFTSEMDNSTLQGLTLDGSNLFISFGAVPEEHRIYHVDLKTGNIVSSVNRPIGMNSNNGYEDGFGEQEGLYLYTNPETGYKTLLTVIVTDGTGRRRQKLYGFSWNAGIQEFLSFSTERTQNVKMTRDDGKGKRITAGTTSLATITEPGEYYLTSDDAKALRDHPIKDAGWYLTVSGGDTTGSCKQTLTRNSQTIAQEFYRIVASSGETSPWWLSSVQEYKS